MSHICQLIRKKELAYQLGLWIGYSHSTSTLREICCQLMDIKVNRMQCRTSPEQIDWIDIYAGLTVGKTGRAAALASPGMKRKLDA